MNNHTNEVFDVIIIGLGANGSSALYHLSHTGKKVLGIDQFQPPHQRGSSHGESRIIRQAYHENPLYVPLVKAAYPLWAALERAAGKQLFRKTGGLILGDEHATIVQGAKRSAEIHDIPYEWLDAQAIQSRFPAFRPGANTVGVLEKEAGILFPEECINAFLGIAEHNGATIRTNEPVTNITATPTGVEITTTNKNYTSEKLIVAAGAWLNKLVPELHLPINIRRQALFWFDNADAATKRHFASENMPIFIWEYAAEKMFYGFPDIGTGVKLAPHHGGRPIQPDELTQDTTKAEIKEIEHLAATHLSMDPVFRHSAVCMYTNTPDEDFIIDHHPTHPNILIASPCSGHGFKFSSLTGKILADLALDKPVAFDLSPFAIDRPALKQAANQA